MATRNVVWTPERRAKQAERLRNVMANMTPQQKAKAQQAAKVASKKPWAPERRAKQAATWTPERRAAQAKRLAEMAATFTPEQRAKARAAGQVARLKAWTPEKRAAAAERARSRPPPLEARRRGGKAAQAAWTPEMRAAAAARLEVVRPKGPEASALAKRREAGKRYGASRRQVLAAFGLEA